MTRTSYATEGIQWIRMEEVGKALTNRCRTVRELPSKKQKRQEGTRDRNTNSKQLEFECQLRTPTQGRIRELLTPGASSSQKLFQSLITNQDLLRLREDMWPSQPLLEKDGVAEHSRQRLTDNAMQQALDHRTVPPFTRTMPVMFKNRSKEKTVTIQTTGQRNGLDLSVGSS